jgi:hypothetical protein
MTIIANATSRSSSCQRIIFFKSKIQNQQPVRRSFSEVGSSFINRHSATANRRAMHGGFQPQPQPPVLEPFQETPVPLPLPVLHIPHRRKIRSPVPVFAFLDGIVSIP